ncbi:NUDIX domain-containing protein [Sphaerisporangium melleum]|uniref:NUDIX domain-containing protein n=1 Tax=Sphaerisporangium melleum TaxID=321316 RepID=UPI0019526BE0|nr:NUDIX hydrolase [Sphaerisporangium melleum]
MSDVDPSFVAGLARVRTAAGALIRDEVGRIMVVHTTYKPDWDIPGGMVEVDESPLTACVREVEEELGLTLPIGPLLCVDWVPPRAPWDSALLFVFDGGVLPSARAADIRLCERELDRAEFVRPDALDGLVKPGMARRLREALSALPDRRTAYLENGHPPA